MPPIRPHRAAAAAGIAKRKAFSKPSEAYLTRIQNIMEEGEWDDIIHTSPASNNLYPNGQDLFRMPFNYLNHENGTMGTHRSVYEVYIQHVCNYVNAANGRDGPKQVPLVCVTSGDFFLDYYQRFLQARGLLEVGFRGGDGETVNTTLHNMRLNNPNDFLQVRHIFMPDRTKAQHVALIVISPMNRTVDFLESDQESLGIHASADDRRLGVVFHLLYEHLGDDFKPYEWRVRVGASPQQGAANDCGIFTMTSALFIAFGYPLNYAGGDMRVRRQVIASEIINAMDTGSMFDADEDAPLKYELTDYWTGKDAKSRARGFQSLNQTMLDVLPLKVRARRGKYAHITSESEMEEIVFRTRGHRGLEMRVWGSLQEFIERVELRDERNRRREMDH